MKTMDHSGYGFNALGYLTLSVFLKVFAWISSASLHEAFAYFASAGAGVAGIMSAWLTWLKIKEHLKRKKHKT